MRVKQNFDFMQKIYFVGAVQLTKNAGPDKYY